MKQNELLRMLAASAIRHGLTLLSAYLVSKNIPLPDDFVGNATNYAVDAIPVIVALVWSAIQKSATHEELTQATVYPPLDLPK